MSQSDRKKKVIAIVTAAAILALSLFIILNFFGGETAAASSEKRTLIDSVTGEVFKDYRIPEGTSFPYVNNSTGAKTLYPAEKCFWTKDGKAKPEPTFVLLNEYANKPGQTICPDCGRPVRAHNPMPPSNLFPQN